MAKGLIRSIERADPSKQIMIKKVIVAQEAAMNVDGASGVGFGALAIGNFPEGNVLFLGAVAYLQFSGPGGDAGLVDAFEGDFGVGTTPADDGTITGADVDIIPSTALAAATAEVGVRTRAEHAVATSGQVFDNTDGSLEINANLLVDDAHISADGIGFTVNGEVYIVYTMLGDD